MKGFTSILALLLSPTLLMAQVSDDRSILKTIKVPILNHSPKPVDLGSIQIGESVSQTISFTNIGASIAKIKSIEIESESGDWIIEDSNDYPVEIHNGDLAFSYNGTDKLNIDVTLAPLVTGESTARLIVTWGLYQEKVYEVLLIGEGISCYDATEAYPGENWAESRNTWFTYTADKFQLVYINTCHPENTQEPVEPGGSEYDTWLYVYSDCQSSHPIFEPELDWDSCAYTKLSLSVEFAMNEGETVKMFWASGNGSPNADKVFFFNIEPIYPSDGDVCESAIPLTLPVVNHFGTTVGFEDDYNLSPCNPWSNYMDGNDKVYTVTLDYDGYLIGRILGVYGSIHVLDECPVEELEREHCLAYASGSNGGKFRKRFEAGTYYIIISSWAPPQTVEYLLNLSLQGLSVNVDKQTSSIKVYPNPTDGVFIVSINNREVIDLTIELLNISGQTVYLKNVNNILRFTGEIDASQFERGLYYLRVNDGNTVRVEKIVIQK